MEYECERCGDYPAYITHDGDTLCPNCQHESEDDDGFLYDED